jgi:hypothetical protein
MAKCTILYWQEIPSLVEAKGDGETHKVQLSERFQELIDLVAVKRKLAGTDEYLLQWSKGKPEQHEGSAREVAETVAGGLEARYEEIRAQAIAKS